MSEFFEAGFSDFDSVLSDYIKRANNVVDILKTGADALVSDVHALPKPRSAGTPRLGTHLLDSVTDRVNGKVVEVGWGIFYGKYWEWGAHPWGHQKEIHEPHLMPTWELNKGKYQQLMLNEFHQ